MEKLLTQLEEGTVFTGPRVWRISETKISDEFLQSGIFQADTYIPGIADWFHTRRPQEEVLSQMTEEELKEIQKVHDSEVIIEMAGRNCYHSWHNPAGRTNGQYINNIIGHKHFSVLEHGSVGYLIFTERATTHELVRHRHLSYSQESTRFVSYWGRKEPTFILPEQFLETEESRATVNDFIKAVKNMYQWAHENAKERYELIQDRTMKMKLSRQAARYFMPHGLSATITITGNYRAWLEAIPKRVAYDADIGIRMVYLQILKDLIKVAPSIFDRFEFKTWEDGTEYAVFRSDD